MGVEEADMSDKKGSVTHTNYAYFELPQLGIYEPAYHEEPIMEQLKAESWGLA